MANDSATLDGLFPVFPSIDSLILGTGEADVLSAQADGNIVLGFEGGDRLNSTFNLTALIGGDGEDTLTTNVIVPLQNDTPGHGVAIQLSEQATTTSVRRSRFRMTAPCGVRDRRMCYSMVAVATMSSTPQQM